MEELRQQITAAIENITSIKKLRVILQFILGIKGS